MNNLYCCGRCQEPFQTDLDLENKSRNRLPISCRACPYSICYRCYKSAVYDDWQGDVEDGKRIRSSTCVPCASCGSEDGFDAMRPNVNHFACRLLQDSQSREGPGSATAAGEVRANGANTNERQPPARVLPQGPANMTQQEPTRAIPQETPNMTPREPARTTPHEPPARVLPQGPPNMTPQESVRTTPREPPARVTPQKRPPVAAAAASAITQDYENNNDSDDDHESVTRPGNFIREFLHRELDPEEDGRKPPARKRAKEERDSQAVPLAAAVHNQNSRAVVDLITEDEEDDQALLSTEARNVNDGARVREVSARGPEEEKDEEESEASEEEFFLDDQDDEDEEDDDDLDYDEEEVDEDAKPAAKKRGKNTVSGSNRSQQQPSDTTRTRKPKVKLIPRTLQERSRLAGRADWVREFGAWLKVEGQISDQNFRQVNNRVLALKMGKGVDYKHWPNGIYFMKGVKVDLSMDFYTMLQEAKDHEAQYGEDKGHGWLMRHAIKKLGLFQAYLLDGEGFSV